MRESVVLLYIFVSTIYMYVESENESMYTN